MTLADTAICGDVASPARRQVVHGIAAGMAFTAVASLVPVALQLIYGSPRDASTGAAALPSWSSVLVAWAVLEVAYALYLIGLPDWSAVLVVAVALLVATTLMAALEAVLLFGGDHHALLQTLQLDGPVADRRQVAGWLFILLLLHGLLGFAAGSFAHRWRRSAGF